MKKLLLILTLGLLSAGVSQQARAASITGNISMGGTASLDTNFLLTATKVNSFSGVTTNGGASGTFDPVPSGVSVTWKPFAWNPSDTPIVDLWKFTHLGITYSFSLNSVIADLQTNKFLNLSGTGVLKATGFDDTPGEWTFGITDSDGLPNTGNATKRFQFGFTNNNTYIPTPEGGSGLAMLGLGLIGVGVLRKKLAPKA